MSEATKDTVTAALPSHPAAAMPTHAAAPPQVHSTVFIVLFGVGFCHALNDMMQSLLQAIYPNLKASFELDFAHIGLVTAVFQVTASLLQPLVGAYTDRRQ